MNQQTFSNLHTLSLDLYKQYVDSYSGGSFDRLSPSGKFLTAVSWEEYPNHSFHQLIVELRWSGNDELAEAVSQHGINYEILGKGDSCKASGHPGGYRYVDTEEWYTDLPGAIVREFVNSDDDERRESIQEAISNFEVAVEQELVVRLVQLKISESEIKKLNELIKE